MVAFADRPVTQPGRAAFKAAPVVALAIALVALALRVYRLDAFALRGDESFTVQFASLPAEALFEGIRSVEPNPPLYYYALRGWMALAGQGEFAARFFSVFFGVLCVPLIYALGRAMGGALVGLIAAGILAVNPFQLFHSQDVRNYTLWPALLIAAWWCLWHAIRYGRIRYWAAYALFTLLGLYTHYYHLFVVFADGLFVGSSFVVGGRGAYASELRRLAVHGVSTAAAIGIGFLAWLAIGSTRAIEEIASGSSPTLLEVIGRTFAALTVGETLPKDQVPWLVIPTIVLIAVGLVVVWRERPAAARLLLIGLIVTLACVFLVAQIRPLYRPRYLNVIAAAYYLFAAFGIAAMTARPGLRRWIGLSIVVAWLIVSGYGHAQALFSPKFAKSPDWRARAEYLTASQHSGDVIVQNYPDPSLGYYYSGDAPLLIVPTGYLDDARRAETDRTLNDLLESYSRIWLLPYADPAWDYDKTVERWLARNADRVWAGQVAGLNVQMYETRRLFVPKIQHLDIRFEQGITLVGYRLEAGTRRPGETIRLVLYWQTEARIPMDYTVFTHILDVGGVSRAQQDNAPVGGTYPTSQWAVGPIVVDSYDVSLPPDLAAGPYTIEVGLYNWMTLNRLPTTQGSDHVVLPVTIEIRN